MIFVLAIVAGLYGLHGICIFLGSICLYLCFEDHLIAIRKGEL